MFGERNRGKKRGGKEKKTRRNLRISTNEILHFSADGSRANERYEFNKL